MTELAAQRQQITSQQTVAQPQVLTSAHFHHDSDRAAVQRQLQQTNSNYPHEFDVAANQKNIYSKGVEISVPHGTAVEFHYERTLADGTKARGTIKPASLNTVVVNDRNVARLGIDKKGQEQKYTVGLYTNFSGTLTIKIGDQSYKIESDKPVKSHQPANSSPPATLSIKPPALDRSVQPTISTPPPDQVELKNNSPKPPAKRMADSITEPKNPPNIASSEQAKTALEKQKAQADLDGDKFARVRQMEALAASAKAAGDKILAEAEKMAEKYNHTGQSSLPATYTRFLTDYTRFIPKLPDKTAIIAQTGLAPSDRNTHAVISPEDPNRPGVIITSDQATAEKVEEGVAELRSATTITLLDDKRDADMYKTRATSIIVFRQGELLDEGVNLAKQRLEKLPKMIASQATLRAVDTTAESGILARIFPRRAERRAAMNTERAAMGGLGARRFDSGLVAGRPEAQRNGQQAVDSAVKLIANRAREYAFTQAAEVERIAIEVWKNPALMGCEVDFDNQRPVGVDYFAPTQEGKTHYLHLQGMDHNNEIVNYVPPEVYGRFNVDILTAYDNGKEALEKQSGNKEPYLISRSQLYQIAMKPETNIFPTEDGDMVYLDPAKHGKAIAQLKEIYNQQRHLTSNDIKKAMNTSSAS